MYIKLIAMIRYSRCIGGRFVITLELGLFVEEISQSSSIVRLPRGSI